MGQTLLDFKKKSMNTFNGVSDGSKHKNLCVFSPSFLPGSQNLFFFFFFKLVNKGGNIYSWDWERIS